MRTKNKIAAFALCTLWLACNEDTRFFDRFPVPFDDSDGPVMLGASLPSLPDPIPAVVDTLSPITVFDPDPTITFPGDPIRIRSSMTLYGYANPLSNSIPRLVYPLASLVSAHPCTTAGQCFIGTATNQVPFSAIIGGDRLSNSSVRMSFCKNTLEFLRDTVGTSSERIETCDVAFLAPFAGGGVYQIDGTEIPFPGARPSFGACVESSTPLDDALGVDLQLLFSSAFGQTILSRTAYEKLVNHSGAASYDSLPSETIYTSSGQLEAKSSTVERLTLVNPIGEEFNARGPCLEIAAHRQVTESGSFEDIDGLPCPNGDSFCQIGPSVELLNTQDIYVVSDEEPLLQSLRDELRPELAEIDGIVGTSAMQSLTVDLDYPNQRILFGCEDTTQCIVRAPIFEQDQLDNVTACVEQIVDNCAGP